MQRLYPRTLLKPAVRTMLVPVPKACPARAVGQRAGRHRADRVTRRPAAARHRPARLVRGTDRGGAQRCGRRAEGVRRGSTRMRRNVVVRRTSMQLAVGGGRRRRWRVAGLRRARVKLGAAATTSQQRITLGHADQRGRQPERGLPADKKKGSSPSGRRAQAPQQVLTWLITFQIFDKLAKQHGISRHPDRRAEPADRGSTRAGQAEQRRRPGPTSRPPAAVPPDLLPQLGRYFAILTAFETRLDGGTHADRAGRAAGAADPDRARAVPGGQEPGHPA